MRTLLLALWLALAPSAEGGLALVGGTVYVSPTESFKGTVLIEDGKIAAVGRSVRIPVGTQVIDCTGLTVTAGFWNSHVHFIERKWAEAAKMPAAELEEQLQEMLTRYGFTSVFDTGSMLSNTRAIRQRIESGDVKGPRIRTTGEVLFPPGGAPAELILDIKGSMRIESPEVANADQARAASVRLVDGGADGVKVYAATWAPPIVVLAEPSIRAAVEEAHRRGKPVFAHPSNRDGLLAAVRAGVDVLVHTAPQSGEWDAATIDLMKRSGVALIPTLKLWRYELRHDRRSSRDRFTERGVSQLRAWVKAGGTVLFGTDVGYMSDYDPAEEYELMARAGMSFPQILASLTTAPAARFRESERLGRIAPGFVADVVVFEKAFGEVRYTIRDGVVIFTSRPQSAPPPPDNPRPTGGSGRSG